MMNTTDTQHTWEQCKTHVFWGEIAPCDHVVQIYDDLNIFLDTLAGFVGDGINSGDSIIVIATEDHLKGLTDKLEEHAISVHSLIAEDQFIPLDAEKSLSEFMVDGWPDDVLFNNFINDLFERAGKRGKNIRVFGEMVAVLWEQGHNGATVHLEHLWNNLCVQEKFSIFCAYPKSGFTLDANESILNICRTHSKVISGENNSMSQVNFRNM